MSSVEGTVAFKGTPIRQGVIRFLADNGTSGIGWVGPIENGQYRMPDSMEMNAGSYLVSIYGYQKTGKLLPVDGSSDTREELRQFVPREFNDATTTIYEVAPGRNTLDFTLP